MGLGRGQELPSKGPRSLHCLDDALLLSSWLTICYTHFTLQSGPWFVSQPLQGAGRSVEGVAGGDLIWVAKGEQVSTSRREQGEPRRGRRNSWSPGTQQACAWHSWLAGVTGNWEAGVGA